MFVTLKNGMGDLIETLCDRLNPESVFLEKPAAALEEGGRGGATSYCLKLEGGETLEADVVVLATPSFVSGDLVTGFRRAKDLVGQLADVYEDLPERREMLRKLARQVSRDEVEVVG